jgi:hypothetical protein
MRDFLMVDLYQELRHQKTFIQENLNIKNFCLIKKNIYICGMKKNDMKFFDWFLFGLFIVNVLVNIPTESIPTIFGWTCASIVQLRLCLTK